MAAFDTEDMTDALVEATNVQPTFKNEEARKLAEEKGWVKPSDFNYAQYNADGKGADDAAAVSGAEWAHSAAKYEWKEEYGELGPEIPELEEQLFRSEFLNRKGLKFDNLMTIQVTAEAVERPAPITDFRAAGLHPVMVKNIEKCNYQHPTPIQAYTIPAVLQGRDVIATAQTGSGKTAAFLIPCISKLMGKVKKLAAPRPNLANGFNEETDRVRAEPLVLVVAPTRELCCQIFDEARRLCYRSMLRPCVAYGGGPIRDQREELAKGCDLLVATPGRLLDFMGKPHVLSLSRVRYTIIDEADEMLHDDWDEEMQKIMGGSDVNEDADHRYLLFSATFGKEMRKLAKKYLANDHVRIRIGRAGSTHINVKQQILWVENNMKQQALYDLVVSMPPSRTLIFVRSKKTADFVDDFLFNNGLPSTSIHSDRTQREREDALRAFRAGKCPILVATGVSARGLDVRNVMHVINFDLPAIEHNGEDEYIHRIGRTARIGNEGLATSFYNDRDEPMREFLIKILLETGQDIPEFWEQYKPATSEEVNFNDDSGAEDEDQNVNGQDGDAWAPGEDSAGAWGSGDNPSDAWGSQNNGNAAPTQEAGWGGSSGQAW